MRSVLLLLVIAGASGPVLADLRHVEGEARDPASGNLLYTEQHWIRGSADAPLERRVLYRCPDGTAFARKRVDYRGHPTAPAFALEDVRAGHREGLRRDGGGVQVWYDGAPRPLKAGDGPLVADAGFDAFVRARWDALVAGTPQPLAFVVPSFGRALGFRVRPAGRDTLDGAPVERFRLSLDGLLGAVAPSLDVAYDARTRELRRFTGVTNLRDDRGRQLKARIDFPRAPRPATEAEWRAAGEVALKPCRLGG